MAEEPKDQELLSALREAESKRRRSVMIGAAVILVFVVLSVVLSVTFSDEIFQPKIDVEDGEQDVLADTNDPQCREFISLVTEIGKDYEAIEPALQDELLGNDRAEIERLVAELDDLKERLEKAYEVSTQAELRFDESRSDINDWHRYIQNELHLLQRVANERLEALPKAEVPDAGTVVDNVAPEKPADEPKSEKTPQERLDGATLAANESFQKFRVWHTGGLHPCGKAAEGETPWAPTD